MKREKLSRCQTLWDRLFSSTPDSSPFVSFEWFDCVSRFLLHADPDVMLLYDQNTCVGIMPVRIHDNTVRFITDERITDLCGFIYRRGYEDDIVNALASFTQREGLHVELYPLAQTNRLVPRFADCLRNATVNKADVNPLLQLPASWDDYLSSLKGKARHELRRKLRKGHAIQLQTCTPDAIESLFALMVQDAHKQEFLLPDVRAFFAAITARFFERGWLRLRSARVNKKPVAGLLAFSFHGRIFLYNMGIDEQYGHLSPGIVAIALDIKDAIHERSTCYDFLRGGEAYKFRFGARTQYTVRLQA